MKKYWVYVHTCPNGKKYVGATSRDPESRWLKGRGYRRQLFEEAILKYGWDNIEHEVFEVDSKEEMYRKEVELISFYHSNDPEYGYNCSIGGEKGALGCIRSEKYRKKMSEAKKGKSHKPHSEEAKRRMSEAKKDKPQLKVKISLPDGTVLEVTKHNLARNYINKGKKFEYVS